MALEFKSHNGLEWFIYRDGRETELSINSHGIFCESDYGCYLELSELAEVAAFAKRFETVEA